MPDERDRFRGLSTRSTIRSSPVSVSRFSGSHKQLGQLRPADTNAASLYSPPTGYRGVVTLLFVTNVAANTPTYRIFHDADGTTYNQDTALIYDDPLTANEALPYLLSSGDWGGLVIPAGGNLAVRSSAADEINFTAYGYEEKVL